MPKRKLHSGHKILVINSGSSSLKYEVYDMPGRESLGRGVVERIGQKETVLQQSGWNGSMKLERPAADHSEALAMMSESLRDEHNGIIDSLDEIAGIGHRVVHGGEKYAKSVVIDDDVVQAIKENIELAPLHNPANLMGIVEARQLFPDRTQVAVFDTAFHQTLTPAAFLYGLPRELYDKYRIRRYGFHGTSHRYVANQAVAYAKRSPENTNVISCHLGNGASVAAVESGKSVDTSMGFTPLEGLVMGTRSGDIDPGAVLQIAGKEDLDLKDLNNLLNKHGGMLGISGLSSDMRDIEEAMEKGDQRAQLAMNVYNYRLKKYIAAYAGAMAGVDGIIFTGGIGENGPITRKGCLDGLEFMGIHVDDTLNNTMIRGKQGEINSPDAPVKIVVIPTNEELVIALDTEEIVSKGFTE